jgi:hypothetical protein
VLQQAGLHLECYKSHEKLLLEDQNTLINKQNVLIEEFSKFKEVPKKGKKSVSKDLLKKYKLAKTTRLSLEDQLVKLKVNLQSLKEKEEKMLLILHDACSKSKKKDSEISILNLQIAR